MNGATERSHMPDDPTYRVVPPEQAAGRPTELTQDVFDAIIRYMGAVYYLEAAAPMAEVPIRTARRWEARGLAAYKAIQRAAKRGEVAEITAADEMCLRFWQALKRARAQLELQHAGNITRTAMGRPAEVVTTERVLADGTVERIVREVEGLAPVWQASAWFLERTNFKRWGRKERLEHTGADGAPLTLAAVREILAEAEPAAAAPALPAGTPQPTEPVHGTNGTHS